MLQAKNKNISNGYVSVSYSFFVAGHVYGNPQRTKPGLYPFFKDKFEYIRRDSLIKFGIFTGDIVKKGTKEEWDEVDKDISELSIPVYFAMGNHDNKNRELFIERYGQTYYSFTCKCDLYIILDPNIDKWNISGDQLDFLKKKLSEIDPAVRNIFVFFHQLLWWSPENKYKSVKPNSFDRRSDSVNFWGVVEPLFRNISCNVVMFAGDVGAASWSADYMYDTYDNITLIASGMGEGKGDNFLIVDIMTDNTIRYRLIPLNCEDMDCLGKLEEFIVSTSESQYPVCVQVIHV
jgi:hypothetical protein